MARLTKRFVDSAPPPEQGGVDRFYWDESVTGFGLRVKPSGVRSYIIQYRQGKRSRRLTLGKHGVLTPDEARSLARQQLGQVARGEDPAAERRKRREAPTMRDLAEDYLERHAIPNKRPASVSGDQGMLKNYVLPKFANDQVADLTRRDFEPLIQGLSKKPYLANRLRSLLSKMFALAIEWGWRDDNPVARLPKFQEERRDRWLSEAELERLGAVLDSHPNQRAAAIVRLLILTGARRGEVLGMTWDQLDLERGVWTKPAHTTKQKRTEHVPLSEAAWMLLREVRSQSPEDARYVFPGDAPGQPITTIKRFWRQVCARADLDDVRIHDLRHTFASHLVSSGVSLPVVGRLLGHTQAQTTQRYAHLADDPLREAANLLGYELSRRE